MPSSFRLLGTKYYMAANGREPAREFLTGLDRAAYTRVWRQIDRAKAGNLAHGHRVGGVQELVVDFGPGYRVYYWVDKAGWFLVLLVAGDKSTQRKDIRRAEAFLQDYLSSRAESR